MNIPTLAYLQATWSPRDYSANSASRAAISLLADGRPVTLAAVAAAAGMGIEEAGAYIDNVRREGAEVEGDALVGLALTLRPTTHQFRVRGNDLYTWCAFDALL